MLGETPSRRQNLRNGDGDHVCDHDGGCDDRGHGRERVDDDGKCRGERRRNHAYIT